MINVSAAAFGRIGPLLNLAMAAGSGGELAVVPETQATSLPRRELDPELWFEDLYDRYHRRIWTYIARREREDIDDLAHDTFVVAWRRRDQVPGDDPMPWLFGVARNILRNHRRARRPEPVSDGALVRLETPRNSAATPEDRVAARDVLFSALAALSATDREILTLTAWELLPAAQVAAAVGISEGTIAVRLHRARRRFEVEYRQLDSAG